VAIHRWVECRERHVGLRVLQDFFSKSLAPFRGMVCCTLWL
jgi:hypothetical protein